MPHIQSRSRRHCVRRGPDHCVLTALSGRKISYRRRTRHRVLTAAGDPGGGDGLRPNRSGTPRRATPVIHARRTTPNCGTAPEKTTQETRGDRSRSLRPPGASRGPHWPRRWSCGAPAKPPRHALLEATFEHLWQREQSERWPHIAPETRKPPCGRSLLSRAETEGFEPSVGLLPLHLSRVVH